MFLLILGLDQARIVGFKDGKVIIAPPCMYKGLLKPKTAKQKEKAIAAAKEFYNALAEAQDHVFTPFAAIPIADEALENLAARPELYEIALRCFYDPKEIETGHCEFCGKTFLRKTPGQRTCKSKACARAQHARIIRDYRASKKTKGKKR